MVINMADEDIKDDIAVSTDPEPELDIQVEGEDEQKTEDQKPVDEREVALSELKAQLEEQRKRADQERIARQRAEQYAQQQLQEAQYAKTEIQDSNLRIIINAIDAAEQAATNAERSLAEALAAGDYAAVAKIQRSMAQIEGQLLQYNNAKATLEERLQQSQGAVEQPQYQPMPQAPQDPVEMLASRLESRSPKSAAWLRAHPQAAYNVQKLTAAHQAAVVVEGIEAESPEYFAYIEQKLGLSDAKPAQKSSSGGRKAALSSAPVSSSSSMSSRSSGDNLSSVHLTQLEVEQAILNEPNLPRKEAIKFYAQNKAALIREGKLTA